MIRSMPLALALVVGGAVAGCPIGQNRDGIGQPCEVSGDACPLDHTCFPDDVSDPDVGVCAPILDYGSCDKPAYPQRNPKSDDDGVLVDAASDLAKVEDLATITGGDLELNAPGAELLELGDLCKLAGVQHVDGAVIVTRTDVKSLDGLQSLGFASGGVLINQNGQLEDVIGLQNLVFAKPLENNDAAILFSNNSSLTIAAIQELKDALAATAPGLKVLECNNKDSPLPNRTCDASVLDLLRD